MEYLSFCVYFLFCSETLQGADARRGAQTQRRPGVSALAEQSGCRADHVKWQAQLVSKKDFFVGSFWVALLDRLHSRPAKTTNPYRDFAISVCPLAWHARYTRRAYLGPRVVSNFPPLCFVRVPSSSACAHGAGAPNEGHWSLSRVARFCLAQGPCISVLGDGHAGT